MGTGVNPGYFFGIKCAPAGFLPVGAYYLFNYLQFYESIIIKKGKEPIEPECYYHFYNHATGNDNLFREEENYRYFLEKVTFIF